MEILLVRLVRGSGDHEGRVEIFHDGRWGTVCNVLWNRDDAYVVCRQLGYSQGVALSGYDFGEGIGPIWLNHLQCTGREFRLTDCPADPWGDNNCRHSKDAAVRCNP